MDNMYKPLPHYVKLSRSPLHGLGIFAKEPILANVDLGMSHIEVHGQLIRTPLGGFYNHSDDPNIESVQVSPIQWNLFTIRNIAEGEELVATYKLYIP